MSHPAAALVTRPQNKFADDPAPGIVLRERQFHAALIRAAAAETFVFGIGRKRERVGQIITALPRQKSDQRHAAAFSAPYAPLALAHFHAKHVGKDSDSTRDLLFVKARKRQT